MKATHRAEYRYDRARISMTCKKLKPSIYVNQQASLAHMTYTEYSSSTSSNCEPFRFHQCINTGWVQIPVKDIRDKPIRTFMIQIAVISNHQNGRDTHMRQIRVHSPIQGRKYPLEGIGKFTTIDFQQYSTIR